MQDKRIRAKQILAMYSLSPEELRLPSDKAERHARVEKRVFVESFRKNGKAIMSAAFAAHAAGLTFDYSDEEEEHDRE